MALREKFGRLVLLEETDASPLGREYRAARLGPAGLDRLVGVLRFTPAISQDAAVTKRLMDEARLAARLSNPGLQRVLGIGRVDQSFYVSAELVEGRTLAAVLERCARESFPFAADHALMVASRAASALEYLHGKKDEAGAALFHGLLAPRHLVVAFDGEVKLKGIGLWRSLQGSALLPDEERAYLAPEQAQGGPGDERSDVYSLARILLSSVTLCPPDGREPLAVLAEARVTATTGETGPVPKPLADLLRRALAADPAARHPSIAEMRKAVDTLLFSGDFTPTTFDLAFFMHTLFREEMEAEARTLEEERKADYREFIAEEKPPAPAPASDPGARSTAADAHVPAPAVPDPTLVESARATVEQHPPATPVADVAAAPRDASARVREAGAREAAARMSLGTAGPEKRGPGLWIAAVAGVLILAAGGGYFLTSRGGASPAPAATPAASSPEAQAAMARVKELEDRIAQLESEKAAAETKAADDARKKLEAQAAAKGHAVDPQALEQAQVEARQRARAEQEARQQAELQRIADARRAEEKRLAEASPPPTPTPAPAPAAAAPAPAPTPTPAPPAAAAVTEPSAEATPATVTATPGVVTPTPPNAAPATVPAAAPETKLTPPAILGSTPPVYPALAKARKIEGVVEVSALVDETGRVAEANIVRVNPKRLGFEEAALAHVRSRKYRPATRDGAPVRVWVSIVVEFKAGH